MTAKSERHTTNAKAARLKPALQMQRLEERFAGCLGIEGEILRCAQNDGVTAKAMATAWKINTEDTEKGWRARRIWMMG
jgi:hypothetical protein